MAMSREFSAIEIAEGALLADIAVLAHYLGAKRVDVYGADWTDEPDFDGVSVTGNRRDAERWRQERDIWHKLTAHLAERGTVVERIGVGTT